MSPDLHAVTVWQVALEQPAEVVARLAGWLAVDEAARAARFHFERDRERYIVARGALRQTLAGCLGSRPEDVCFVYSAAGKPALDGHAADDLRFNLSHSGALALIAVTEAADIGVDVELVRDLPDLADIARRFFAPAETARLLAIPAADRLEAFYRCWTRKEAYLKARGEGLMAGLDRFEVAFLPGEKAAVLKTHDDPAEAGHWTLIDLTPDPRYAAALAVAHTAPQLRLQAWSFSPEAA